MEPAYLLPVLSRIADKEITEGDTLIVFDEIQLCERASEFENAIEWLCLSGIVLCVNKAKQIKKPLENYADIDSFKTTFRIWAYYARKKMWFQRMFYIRRANSTTLKAR